ncbi:MAG: phosphate transport system regulatory protein PhoU [Candidatus Glassbacteria bacterium RIFCSPLOWO2_12_FULL_58_11]|uniref:Phosphate-specific transport system accessory protein PhoU n=1 Tax=Candidatus Glassbacteria bacterium RIFCSPLOWO2_12_FULL_58_11 TaxID=1817867 RepID=A0A1F5YKY6_9BACT|nr:MAG: phosphate transport system regulatory protein PhoU [Candidatus Glassbacteria bacterium RIFCSPLOWO2_12_FULL_58_11]
MSQHLQKSIEKLKRRILAVSALAEESVYLAVRAVEERDAVLARKVIESDVRLDEEEVDVEEECLKILALHQPVALDLRFIVSVLKINSDLERIGDMAVNIAERAAFLAAKGKVVTTFDFPGMTEKTRTMLRNALDALVNRDAVLARKVIAADDEVDMINRHMYEQIKKAIEGKKDDTNNLLHLLSVSRYLERIADHATNIAEDVVYMVEGTIVRHKSETDGQTENALEEE